MDSFYKPLSPEQLQLAFRNEYDVDVPSAIDFDLLVDKLRELKQGKKTEIPIYSFAKHARLENTTSIYSPHVLILEGIFALYDPRVLELLDLKIFAEADADTCLARRITRDIRTRGRDLDGVIKQWFAFVKPNFERYVDPQRKQADIIVPRGIDNKVAIDIIVKHIQRLLTDKSHKHRAELKKLGMEVEDEPLSDHALPLTQTPQIRGMSTIIQDCETDREDFIFYFDRLAALLIEKSADPSPSKTHALTYRRALDLTRFRAARVETPSGAPYNGFLPLGEVSAVVILRAGAAFATGLRRVIPDCRTGRMLIKTNFRTGEPELHYLKLASDISTHEDVLLLDPQMSSGAAALMAVKVLVDHGVLESRIVVVTYTAPKLGINRLCNVFPGVKLVVGKVVEDYEERWIATRYFGC
ncbi:MAG: Uridine kinase [Thelocarpon superellum]|nr:MAG: Uridine kinase [Thelocarpon superellum]